LAVLPAARRPRADKTAVQLFAGWGDMGEYPIARAYADARITKIAGRSIEIIKLIIARQLAKKATER
jgi:alkylation response protein AidB-like acyl-CoA dehydrogenase